MQLTLFSLRRGLVFVYVCELPAVQLAASLCYSTCPELLLWWCSAASTTPATTTTTTIFVRLSIDFLHVLCVFPYY